MMEESTQATVLIPNDKGMGLKSTEMASSLQANLRMVISLNDDFNIS